MTDVIEMKVEELLEMVTEREGAMNQMVAQFNLRIGQLQGEISMINLLIEKAEKDEALPSEDEPPE
ncbi:hypothetical protein LCGC14_2075570 [marine sediment metagenome]|uniref:Uncharacterized protein n=1 Tax=marine sediment metagenome TaxID=412755 RepID=A0A0F9F4I0_9ZZZZ